MIRSASIRYRITVTLVILLFSVISFSAYSQEELKLSHGPYLQAMTDSSVSIVWTTNKPATAWVELAPNDNSSFYEVKRPKTFSATDGIKNVGTVHRVRLNNLNPNTRYRYRVYSQEVLKREWTNIYYGKVVATDVYKKKPLSFITSGKSGPFEFAVVNDIHERSNVLSKLLRQLNFSSTDFVFFNGDMISSAKSEEQIFKGFMDTATDIFASEIPMYYARGNHETRGPFASQFANYFPTISGHLYYMFSKGDVCFVVLDGGEDKPDSDIEYSGITDMDAYRSEETKWLIKAVNSEAFKKAKYKILVCHIPPTGNWHGNEEIIKKWMPILNNSGIQIYIGAHEHRHRIVKPNEKAKFPVIVNSNNNIIKASVSEKEVRFHIYDTTGHQIDELSIH